MQNSDVWIRLTNLYWSQTSPVVLCMQYSIISIRMTCLYGTQPLSVAFACKTETFGAELQVCMGPWLHLSFCACKTAWLTSELLVSKGPSPRLWFLDAKQRLLHQNNESLWVPDLTCRFSTQNSEFCTRITNLYGYKASPVILCMQNSVISIRITGLYGSKPLSVAFAFKPAPFGAEVQVSIGPRPHLSFCTWKTAWFSTERQVYVGSSPHLFFLFFFIRNSDFGTRLTSLYGSQTSSVVLSTHNSVLSPRIKRLYVTWFAKIDHFPHFGEVELLPPYSFPGIWEHVKKIWRRSDLPLWRYTAKYSLF